MAESMLIPEISYQGGIAPTLLNEVSMITSITKELVYSTASIQMFMFDIYLSDLKHIYLGTAAKGPPTPRNVSKFATTTRQGHKSSTPIPSIESCNRKMSSVATASIQPVIAPLTRSFLVLSVTNTSTIPTIHSTLAILSSLAKNAVFRDSEANFTCTVGIGSSIWDELTNNLPRPKELHPW